MVSSSFFFFFFLKAKQDKFNRSPFLLVQRHRAALSRPVSYFPLLRGALSHFFPRFCQPFLFPASWRALARNVQPGHREALVLVYRIVCMYVCVWSNNGDILRRPERHLPFGLFSSKHAFRVDPSLRAYHSKKRFSFSGIWGFFNLEIVLPLGSLQCFHLESRRRSMLSSSESF